MLLEQNNKRGDGTMNGLELSRRYYMAFGEPMLREQFAEWVRRGL